MECFSYFSTKLFYLMGSLSLRQSYYSRTNWILSVAKCSSWILYNSKKQLSILLATTYIYWPWHQ